MLASVARIFLLASLLSACSTPAPETPGEAERAVTLDLHASAALNPGATGQPAPVRVRIFELKNAAAFSRADYFALAERAAQTLGPDLVDQDEVLLRPGETRSVVRPLNPATRHVGLVVGYREIDRARWRTVLDVSPRQGQQYRIDLDAQAVRSDAVNPATRTAQ
ncbi:type VI secretion system lipoprotein TssJ [Pseudomonas sp. DTU_2021_1001937_2_SI_NGA_ILE_001]|uniref:type VI secretion system lipoprotein TssJ n=1 Tax=Pseudomonas sp. DTU_2021_1001937_2_SI_NGA_ILE_001 TaxID=3077589 RepID=UPI0025E02C40|nr:type VI secretion system lipoprotein TssJ [Pseudomonas sp. DTU_2021_1001937_2_SI_NGA_ILE_001]WNW12462.1 type VI secretion system lipoprotein TssJ [Pseudomonas sp. DTU_2021_1001937_2_SI_NGA_ILE_001]